MYDLGKVIGALLHYHRLKKSPNIENVEIYLDLDRVLDTFGPDVKKGILEIFAEGRFCSMSEKKLRTHKPTLEEITRRLNGGEPGRFLGGLAGGDGSLGCVAGGAGSLGGMAGGTGPLGHLGGCCSATQAATARPELAWEDWH
jgi:hypothetical protein